MIPILIVTRPAPGDTAFMSAITARWTGALRVIPSPLLKIAPLDATLPDAGALVFTSVHGVAQAPRLGARPGTPAYCVGTRTGHAASDAGFAVRIGQGTARELTDLIIATKPAQPLAHIRGVHTRGDISETLRQAGLTCHDVPAYSQTACPLNAEAQQALAGDTPVVVPLFSPRSTTIFEAEGPFRAPVHVIAISDAARTRSLMKSCQVAAAPTLDAMVDATLTCLGALDGADQ
ncbi:uroporphyrinogen-III synthase [Yoonia sp. SS1-5]|uniref:Uroporphyrinogen-III synthase n=1 Tax=Yoonia rhodophyticola TaxID=3137370 RepID=A0AAN0MB80_9RHOB